MMIDTNYRVEALEYLLDSACLSERYSPLIPFKEKLIEQSRKLDCKTKDDLATLSDEELAKWGLDEEALRLLRRFLTIYDPNAQKFREIEKLALAEDEHHAFQELYYLPGVKQTRASLYFLAGYQSLKAISEAMPQDILENTALAISTYQLSCIVPLPKEVRTHIAVAKAFTQRSNEKPADSSEFPGK